MMRMVVEKSMIKITSCNVLGEFDAQRLRNVRSLVVNNSPQRTPLQIFKNHVPKKIKIKINKKRANFCSHWVARFFVGRIA